MGNWMINSDGLTPGIPYDQTMGWLFPSPLWDGFSKLSREDRYSKWWSWWAEICTLVFCVSGTQSFFSSKLPFFCYFIISLWNNQAGACGWYQKITGHGIEERNHQKPHLKQSNQQVQTGCWDIRGQQCRGGPLKFQSDPSVLDCAKPHLLQHPHQPFYATFRAAEPIRHFSWESDESQQRHLKLKHMGTRAQSWIVIYIYCHHVIISPLKNGHTMGRTPGIPWDPEPLAVTRVPSAGPAEPPASQVYPPPAARDHHEGPKSPAPKDGMMAWLMMAIVGCVWK